MTSVSVRRFLLGCEPGNDINQGLICFSIFLAKARDLVPKIIRIEPGVGADFSGEKAFAERAEGNKSNSKLFEGRQDQRFRLSPPERVFALKRSYRLDRVRATDGLHAGL